MGSLSIASRHRTRRGLAAGDTDLGHPVVGLGLGLETRWPRVSSNGELGPDPKLALRPVVAHHRAL